MASKCRSCGAAITWARTSAGRSMPIDAEPCADGNIVLSEPVDPDAPVIAMILTAEQVRQPSLGEPRYVSHFATCPNAARHRRA